MEPRARRRILQVQRQLVPAGELEVAGLGDHVAGFGACLFLDRGHLHVGGDGACGGVEGREGAETDFCAGVDGFAGGGALRVEGGEDVAGPGRCLVLGERQCSARGHGAWGC